MSRFRDLEEQAIQEAESIRTSNTKDGTKTIVTVPSRIFCQLWQASVRECWGVHNERRRVSGTGGFVFVEGSDPDLEKLAFCKMYDLEPKSEMAGVA